MRLCWGQGKIEVMKRRQEILDFLADGMTESEIFRRLKAKGLKGDKATFHRAMKHLKAEQQPAALPVPVPKSQAPKVSDKQPDQPSRPEPSSQHEGQTKRGAFYKSTQRDPRSLI
jgi:hypothetical protein